MRSWTLSMAGLVAALAFGAGADPSVLQFPQVADYGGVAPVPPHAAEPPHAGAKVVFDVTAEIKPEDPSKGLEAVARYLNLNAAAGLKPMDVKLAVVLHGGATRAALDNSAYSRATGVSENPNLKLIHSLKTCGVEVFVCGQSLARSNFALEDVAAEVDVAVSAMTVNVNKQQDGYSYLSIH